MASQTPQTSQTQTRISVANAKGGTGKSTIAINVAAALAEMGESVLLVDVDPQGNLTEGLGFESRYDDDPPNLFDVLAGASVDVDDLIVTHEEGIDVLPSNIDMLRAERELMLLDLAASLDGDAREEVLSRTEYGSVPERSHGQLARVLDDVDEDYSYVVLDTPPFFGELLSISLVAAPNLLVPALTESSSKGAIELLYDEIAALEEETGNHIDTIGCVANRIEQATNESERLLKWLNLVFEDEPVWEARKRVSVQYAFSTGESVLSYAPGSDIAETFTGIARYIVEDYDAA